ncbi:hypothetical protein BJ085DRAFT_38625 [Dimargaris cristalligena]|uniref:Uncharacterized protein n=1 Tax=Dimargaris cristalligena TaxID=215637 RepID=A0A4P9ZXL8_9FUNG|nr:hypothetical protein BJ085DRAFT_38625 [Dimargaris cristalligena]|eukprot:RKP38403.1 hypothetical protein BJ085DRAFT_38625 [Dimargaris cristalligena]
MASSFISSTTGGGGASSSSTTSYSNARFYNPFGPALDSPQVTFHRPFDDMSPPHHQHPSAAMDIPLLSLAKPRATATGFGTAESTELDSNDDAAESNDGGPGEAEEEEEEEDTFIPPGLACDMELTTFSKTPTHNSTTNSNGRPGANTGAGVGAGPRPRPRPRIAGSQAWSPSSSSNNPRRSVIRRAASMFFSVRPPSLSPAGEANTTNTSSPPSPSHYNPSFGSAHWLLNPAAITTAPQLPRLASRRSSGHCHPSTMTVRSPVLSPRPSFSSSTASLLSSSTSSTGSLNNNNHNNDPATPAWSALFPPTPSPASSDSSRATTTTKSNYTALLGPYSSPITTVAANIPLTRYPNRAVSSCYPIESRTRPSSNA